LWITADRSSTVVAPNDIVFAFRPFGMSPDRSFTPFGRHALHMDAIRYELQNSFNELSLAHHQMLYHIGFIA